MASTASRTIELLDCPACSARINATLAAEVELTGEIRGGESTATVKLTGCRVSHDCTPKVARGVG